MKPFLPLATLALLVAPLGAQTVTTFSSGAEGWTGPQGIGGATTIDATGGNPDHNLHTVFNDFGITFRNGSNPGFARDYTTAPSVTISHDLEVESISSIFTGETFRPWLLELRDYDNPEPGYPWTSVWYKFDDISAGGYGTWTTLSVTIEDTSAADLPAGWGGYGAETGLGEPILPPNRTFSSVLAGVDEIALSTLEPGFFFIAIDFDVRIDNPRVDEETQPGTPTCFGVGCPCGNDHPSAGCVNSTGVGGQLTATGSTSVAANDLTLVATDLPPNNSGLVFGADQLFAMPVFVGDGLGCAGGSSHRYFPGTVDASGTYTQADLGPLAPPGFIGAGKTRFFQAWTRDVLCGPPPAPCPTPCGNGNNLTNAYEVTFTP